MSKLTENQKKSVIKLFNKGCVTKSSLAKEFNVSARTIGRILSSSVSQAKPKDNNSKVVNKVKSKAEQIKPDESQKPIKIESVNKLEQVQDIDWDNIPIVVTKKTLTMTVKSIPYVIDNTHELYEDILNMVIGGEYEKAYKLMNKPIALNCYYDGLISVENGKILYNIENGTPYEINTKLTSRILDYMKGNDKSIVSKLVKFLDRLMLNPSYRAVNELYGFLVHADIEIADDGTFYAWKGVDSDFKDCRTHTFDNSVGAKPRVNRNQVDEDSEVTCSHGLHVCAKDYLNTFGGAKKVKVKVCPSDVVAIPQDYNNTKMRCAGYEVVEDVTNTWNK